MALDPKEVLKKNKPLAAFYGASVACVILCIVLWTMSRSGVSGGLSKDLQAWKQNVEKAKAGQPVPEDLYTKQDIADLEEYQKKHKDEVKAIVKLYREKDAALEKWFEDAQKSGGELDEGVFQTTLAKKWREITDKFAPIAGPFNPEDKNERSRIGAQPSTNQPKKAQKHYWIVASILETCQPAGSEVLVKEIVSGGINVTHPPAPATKVSAPDVGDRIKVSFSVIMQFRKLPILVNRLLKADLPFEVREMKVDRVPFRIEDDKIGLKVNADREQGYTIFDKSIYSMSFPVGSKGFDGTEEDYIPEPTVKVAFELDVLDFNEDALKAIYDEMGGDAKPAAQPEPEEE